MKKNVQRHVTKRAAAAVALMMLLASCGNAATNPPAGTNAPAPTNAAETQAPVVEANPYAEEVVLDVFQYQANEQGLLSGFMLDTIKEKFNMNLNCIAPNIGGEAIYHTRAAAGNLGDLVYLDHARTKESVESGIIMEISEVYNAHNSNLLPYQSYIDAANEYIGQGGMYAIPANMSNLSPTTPYPTVVGAMLSSQDGAVSSLRWDAYKAIGAPAIESMDGLLDVLQQMQAAVPASDSGRQTYPFSLFPDWDGLVMTCVSNSFAPMYGYTMLAGSSTVYAYGDVTDFKTQRIDDEDGYYYQTLKMLYEANQMGLVDPDSPTQTWGDLTAKTADGQVLFGWWAWSTMSHFNTPENVNADEPRGFQFVPIADAQYYNNGYTPAGQGGHLLSIGAKTNHADRLMDFLNWLASPEGVRFRQNGPQGMFWDVIDGVPQKTELGNTTSHQEPLPAEWGGVAWESVGQWLPTVIHGHSIDTEFGVPYLQNYWPNVLDTKMTKLDTDWREAMGARDMIDYCTKNGMYIVAPGNSFVAPADSTDIQNMRSMCGTFVVNASWQMIFAENEASFNSIWDNMKTQIYGTGWEEIVEVDLANANAWAEACREVLN